MTSVTSEGYLEFRAQHAAIDAAAAFARLRDRVAEMLERPRNHAWSVQGLGMMRLYLDPGKRWRLHVWSGAARVERVSSLHDHPWDFRSMILSGRIVNVRYRPVNSLSDFGPGAADWDHQRIVCGPGGCAKEPLGLIALRPGPDEVYSTGATYSQRADEVHDSRPDEGTVTLIERVVPPGSDGETARVFWEPGKSWVSAEPRPARLDEVLAISAAALAIW